MLHPLMTPVMGHMAAPAVLGRFDSPSRGILVLFLNQGPEMRISVGKRRSMAAVAISPIRRRMAEGRNVPCSYSVTLPALRTEKAVVGIEMALGAEKIAV